MATLESKGAPLPTVVPPPQPTPWYRSWRFWVILLISVPLLVYAWRETGIDLVKLFTRLDRAGNVLSRLLRPNWEILGLVAERMGVSVLQALMATLFAVIVAVPLSFFGARNLMKGSWLGNTLYYLVRGFFNIFRSFEVLVIAIVFVTIVGIGPFAGVLGLFVHTVAALGKLYSEQIESIDTGPMEAITATGASRLQSTLYAVVPQIINPYIAFTIYRWDVNVRMSIIVGFVGGGGVGQLLQQYTGLLQWRNVGTVAVVTVVVVWILDYASARIREKLL